MAIRFLLNGKPPFFFFTGPWWQKVFPGPPPPANLKVCHFAQPPVGPGKFKPFFFEAGGPPKKIYVFFFSVWGARNMAGNFFCGDLKKKSVDVGQKRALPPKNPKALGVPIWVKIQKKPFKNFSLGKGWPHHMFFLNGNPPKPGLVFFFRGKKNRLACLVFFQKKNPLPPKKAFFWRVLIFHVELKAK